MTAELVAEPRAVAPTFPNLWSIQRSKAQRLSTSRLDRKQVGKTKTLKTTLAALRFKEHKAETHS